MPISKGLLANRVQVRKRNEGEHGRGLGAKKSGSVVVRRGNKEHKHKGKNEWKFVTTARLDLPAHQQVATCCIIGGVRKVVDPPWGNLCWSKVWGGGWTWSLVVHDLQSGDNWVTDGWIGGHMDAREEMFTGSLADDLHVVSFVCSWKN